MKHPAKNPPIKETAMTKPTTVAPGTAQVNAALAWIDALFTDINEMGDLGIAMSIVLAADGYLSRMRAVMAGEPDEELDMYALPALLDGARHLPNIAPGAKALLHNAHAFADAVADVMQELPDTSDEAVAKLKAVLVAGGQVAPAAVEQPATAKDMRDEVSVLTKNLIHLSALLHMTYGNSAESFESLNDEARDNYLWHCSELTDECSALANRLETGIYRMGAVLEVPHA